MLAAIKFAKCDERAILPDKRGEDACFDLWMLEDSVTLEPGETKLLKVEFISVDQTVNYRSVICKNTDKFQK